MNIEIECPKCKHIHEKRMHHIKYVIETLELLSEEYDKTDTWHAFCCFRVVREALTQLMNLKRLEEELEQE